MLLFASNNFNPCTTFRSIFLMWQIMDDYDTITEDNQPYFWSECMNFALLDYHTNRIELIPNVDYFCQFSSIGKSFRFTTRMTSINK